VLAVGIAASPLIFRLFDWVCVIPPSNTCINNLSVLDGAKQQWALEEHKTTNDSPTMAEISRYMPTGCARAVPVCPAGGVYTLGRACDNPRCSIKGHELH
jgi:hypothetical protein